MQGGLLKSRHHRMALCLGQVGLYTQLIFTLVLLLVCCWGLLGWSCAGFVHENAGFVKRKNIQNAQWVVQVKNTQQYPHTQARSFKWCCI